ncbi:HisJ family histidinol phosphate phosphatase [Pseudovirgaria hyperparasitica]|uniref:Histidinol-phosphatase n=1 Tax=Pseudovirgaria hyperparasitica TaxID=470096 RepID=A0A6A6WLK8_9PEZI|nr:HisJ family histidinol phosphate phosphatase [Pseudovirgaria hyperparasitica]KAF2762889.1 HisJ family histidinol phosphate phosphatase [Pseudovirgaria hyperparasitica]
MPFSHHSHSGQFCPGHAKNTLEEMVQTAISSGMRVFALTEHMPRDEVDFYPEEVGNQTAESLWDLIDDFYQEATRLRMWYGHQMKILIGFESEWIRKSSLRLVRMLQAKHDFDFFVGSVHHVHTVPIDFDKPTYDRARMAAGGSDEKLFGDYFDSQYDMLKALEPQLVGHFDLIRLFSDEPDGGLKRFPGVWQKVIRNLRHVVRYGGILELNSAALRKGLKEPYPCLEVCQVCYVKRQPRPNCAVLTIAEQTFQMMGGKFAMSDDSHAVDQVATHYIPLMRFIAKAEISAICHLNQVEPPDDYDEYGDDSEGSIDRPRRWPKASVSCVCVEELFEEAVDDSPSEDEEYQQ